MPVEGCRRSNQDTTSRHPRTQPHLTKCRNDIQDLPPSVTALPLPCNLRVSPSSPWAACQLAYQRANVPSFPVPPPPSFTRVPSSASAGSLQPPLYDQHINLRRTWNGSGPWSTYTQTLFVRHTTPGNRQDQAMSQVQQATLAHLISSHLISIIPY